VSQGESDTTSMLQSFVTRLVQLLEGYVGNDDRNKGWRSGCLR